MSCFNLDFLFKPALRLGLALRGIGDYLSYQPPVPDKKEHIGPPGGVCVCLCVCVFVGYPIWLIVNGSQKDTEAHFRGSDSCFETSPLFSLVEVSSLRSSSEIPSVPMPVFAPPNTEADLRELRQLIAEDVPFLIQWPEEHPLLPAEKYEAVEAYLAKTLAEDGYKEDEEFLIVKFEEWYLCYFCQGMLGLLHFFWPTRWVFHETTESFIFF